MGTHWWKIRKNPGRYQSSRVDRFPKIILQFAIMKRTHLFIILERRDTTPFFSPPDFPNIPNTANLTNCTPMSWLSHIGPIEMPFKFGSKRRWNLFEQRWNPIHLGQHPKLQHWCGTLVWEPWPWQKDLFQHSDARLVTYRSSQKLYIGCTFLMPVILKRSANAVVRVLSFLKLLTSMGTLVSWCPPTALAISKRKTSPTEHQEHLNIRQDLDDQGDAIWCDSIALGSISKYIWIVILCWKVTA